MGQRDGFSKTDIAKLNKLYQCESHTDEAELTPDDTSNTRAPLQTECIDKTWRCKFWKIFGYCDQDFYQRQCQKSCRTCRTSVVPSPTTSSYNRRVTTTTITTRPSTPSETNPEESDCEDISSRCKVWADSGMCHRQKMIVHMKVLCKLTCNLCFTSTVRTTKRQLPANRGNSIPSKCEDQFSSCRRLVETGRGSCTSSFQKYCRKSCGLC